MNCNGLESLIALYVEGDLPVLDRQRLESHLQSCTVCCALADGLRESQSMFKVLRAGTVNSSDLAGVRNRVLNEVGDLDPTPGWVITMHRLFFAGLRHRNAIAGVLLAALVSGGLWYSRARFVHEGHERKSDSPVEVARLDAPAVFVSPDPVSPPPEAPRVLNRRALQAAPVEVSPDAPAVPAALEPFPPQLQVSQVPPMKFVTDDPNIIIYWLPSDKGD